MIKICQDKRWKVLPNVDYGRDLDATIPGTKNFKYGEAVESETAVKHGIANVPTEAEWKRIESFASNVLQPLRDRFGGLHMSSWFRCIKLNTHKDIGGSELGFHPTGGGGDIERLDGGSLMEMLEWAYRNLPELGEIIAEHFPNGWVHIGYIAGDNRRKLKLKDADHHFVRLTIDELRKLYPKG